MTVVNHADVTATEDGSFIGIVGDGKLCQVQCEFLSHVEGEDETFHGFIGCPLFLGRAPSYRSVASNNFSKLGLDKSQGASLSIAFFMKLFDGVAILAGSEHQLERTYFLIEHSLDGRNIVDNFACN